MRGLAVERGTLVRVLAVGQVRDLLQNEREALRIDVVGDLVEIGRDLRVVGGHGAECIGSEAVAGVGGDLAERPQLLEHGGVVLRPADGDDAGGVPGGSAEERRARDVDQLDRLVDADVPSADLRREGLDVDDDEVDEADPVLHQLLQLVRVVPPGEDAGVDRRMKGADLAADERGNGRQVADRGRLDAVRGKMLAGAVRGEQLHAQGLQLSRERGDSLAPGNREQRTHLGGSSSGFYLRRPAVGRDGTCPRPFRAGAILRASIPRARGILGRPISGAGPCRPCGDEPT